MTPMEKVNLVGAIADLKDLHYQNALVISALVELLIAKGILTAGEIADQARLLEDQDTADADTLADLL